MKRPLVWLLLLLLVPLLLGVKRLRFDVEVLDLLPNDLKAVQGLKLYQQHFANARELVITLHGVDAEQTTSAARQIAERLRKETNLVSSVVWEPPWLEHPEQAAELIAYLWLNQPTEAFRELTNRLAPEKLNEALATVREQLATSMSPGEIARSSYDPFGLTQLTESASAAAPSFGQGQEMFSSPDGKFRIIFVEANRELGTYRECASWLGSIKEIVEGGRARMSPSRREQSVTNRVLEQRRDGDILVPPSEMSIGYTGRPAFVTEIAGGMQHDMTLSIGGTSVIIGILFWLAHRRVKPMLWLLVLLALVLGSTLALGGLIFGTISVVSMGFAAILLGLAVDYAVVHYQEALAHPDLTIQQVRRAIAPSIFWAAVTTISAFLVLNFGGLPGLGQLGSLVGLGVGLAASMMIFAFLPPLFPERWKPGSGAVKPQFVHRAESAGSGVPKARWIFGLSALLVIGSLAVLAFGFPRMDSTADPLRPRESPAYSAAEEIKNNLNQKREPLWLLVAGKTEAEVAQQLKQSEGPLSQVVSNHVIAGFTLPTALWPDPQAQVANRPLALDLVHRREALRKAAEANGFAQNAFGLTEKILDTWQAASQINGTFWPTNPMSRWIFGKVTSRTPTNLFALGFINPTESGRTSAAKLSSLEAELPQQNVWLSGWEMLGSAIFSKVKNNMWKLLTPMVSLVLLSLWLAFRRAREILLSLSVLILSALCLLSIMRLAHWSWNLLNLMALPLILGTGVDYSIFMQLALRRYGGDLRMAYRSVGRALLLCGATAIAGFGSLAWSNNAGMASLGQVCAVGIAGNMLISIFLLPKWWKKIEGRGEGGEGRSEDGLPSKPSFLYRAGLWRIGLLIVRLLPEKLLTAILRGVVGLYWVLARCRREVVIQNLLPALNGNRAEAHRMARKLFSNFATKLADLFRFEAGLSLDHLFGEAKGWEHLARAHEEKRGVLVLTPHLGNWEFGGPWLTRRGIPLQVITFAEPGQGFTQLRKEARAQWNIETFVIGDDPFAFIEVIRRLESGATVALLMDRPPPSTAVTVQLFGKPFAASIAAAELARASGCALVPVYIPRGEKSYSAHVMPALQYDRAALRDRETRIQLTQKIMQLFEPAIRQHLDQWYHFVPVWKSPEMFSPKIAPDYKVVEPLKNH